MSSPAAARSWSSRRAVRTYQSFLWSCSRTSSSSPSFARSTVTGCGRAVGDLVDPAVLAVGAVGVVLVALAGVGPVGDVDAAVGAVLQLQAAEPGVVGEQEVRAVRGDVAGALALEAVVVDAVAVDVAGEERVAVARRASCRRGRSSRRRGRGRRRPRRACPCRSRESVPVAAGPVDVVGAALHQPVGVRVEVLAVHPLEVRPGDDVAEVRDDAVGDEHLAVVVEVEAPGVGRAVGDDLEDLPRRVVAPDAAVDRRRVARRACRACRRASSTGCRCSPRASRRGPRSGR